MAVDQVTCRLNPNSEESAYSPLFIQENRDMQGFLLHKLLDGFLAFVGSDEK
jgi:hypothetical protein